MLKFFRKLRHSLLSAGKYQRYLKYAFGEIFLVMIGILLALQVNNWNQKRIAQAKEKIILSELHQEFVENKKQFEEVIAQHRQALKICNNWIAKFPIDQETINLDSLPKRNDGMHRRFTFNPSQGIINSLISTSSFELISNRELRKLLVSWNDVLLDYQEDELHSKTFVIEQLNPFINKYFHYNDNYSDSRINATILSSLEFENLIYQRKEFLIDNLERRNEANNIEQTINRIIELSKT